jgi:ABC-type transport system substrate-binding protein
MKKFVFIILTAVLIIGILFVSCGEDETTEPTSTTQTTTTTSEPTQTTTAGPVSGGIYRGIVTGGPAMMSYRGQMGPADHSYMFPAVEYMVEPYVDEQGNRGWIPFLCESYNIDPDTKTFTYKIRDGIKFHDGSILDAEVLKWNIQQQIDSGWWQDADKVVSIETPDNSTVIINFTEYSNQYEFNWGWCAVWSKAAWEANAGEDKSTTSEQGIDWAVGHVVGTGPFVLKEYKRDVSISWEKFDDYWQEGKPYLDGLEFTVITEATTASQLLQAGDVDSWGGATAQEWKDLESKGFLVKGYWPGLPMALWPNTVNPDSKWQDKNLREALEYALDKETMADALGLGYYVASEQIAPSTEWGYIPDLPTRGYNEEKARELLAMAGYDENNPCPVTLLVQAVPADIDAGESIKGYLDDAGFDVTLDLADPGRFFGSVFGTGWEDVALMFYGMDVNYLATYMSWFSSDPKSNLASFARPPEQVAMDEEVVLIADTQGQIEMTERLCRYLYEEARLCPLWWVPSKTVTWDYVHHEILRHGFIRVDYENIWMDPH